MCIRDRYNVVKARHGYYNFKNINIVSAGERDPDADDVSGMSASKMRAAATNNDYDTFQKGLPRGFKNGNQLFKDVRKGMNLKENSKYSDEEIERDLYVRGAIYQIGDLVENINDGTSGEIIRRGTNYVQYTDGDNVYKLTIAASDGSFTTNSDEISITVLEVNNPPVISDLQTSYTLDENMIRVHLEKIFSKKK